MKIVTIVSINFNFNVIFKSVFLREQWATIHENTH